MAPVVDASEAPPAEEPAMLAAFGGPQYSPRPTSGFHIGGGNPALKEMVAVAVDTATNVYADERFWTLVEKRPWLAGPDDTKIMSGHDVRSALQRLAPSERNYDITRLHLSKFAIIRTFIKSKTVAQTAVCGLVSLDRDHIQSAKYLVNTIAHENTHFLATGSLGCDAGVPPAHEYEFTDGDHPEELIVWLVSYGIGDLAQCFAENDGEDVATSKCVDGIINGFEDPPDQRLQAECCACTTCADDAVVRKLRTESGRCTNVKCTRGCKPLRCRT